MLDPSSINEKAMKLLEVKKRLAELLLQERQLKDELLSHVKAVRSIKMQSGEIRYYEGRESNKFCRKDTLDYINRTFGKDVAGSVDQNCSNITAAKGGVSVYLNKNKPLYFGNCNDDYIQDVILSSPYKCDGVVNF